MRSEKLNRLSNCFASVLALVLWNSAVIAIGHADTVITVDPKSPVNITADDTRQLKHLASGVGWEFNPNAETTTRLKGLGMKSIRCINVDPLEGFFDAGGKFNVTGAPRLDAHLETCKQLGAIPHIILATNVHPDLQLKADDPIFKQGSIMGNGQNTGFGPTDWKKYRAYCVATFEYILITKGYANAIFEIGNEPDGGGSFVPAPPKPQPGTAALYDTYLNLYKNISQSADEFEALHPTIKVRMGGPALAWAFTFRYGDFNWSERFIRDCRLQKLRLDFIGVHFYGNISSLHGEYESNFPSFLTMLAHLKAARDSYAPGTPIWMTEWGPSYVTTNSSFSVVNADNVGAAWSADFLTTMLENGVDNALFLVTTDLQAPPVDGKRENIWGWPSLFMNPGLIGDKVVPKAPAHVFDMINRLAGKRVDTKRTSPARSTVRTFASADAKSKKITVMLWNFDYNIHELSDGVENAKPEKIQLNVAAAERFFGGKRLKVERFEVSEKVSNAYWLFKQGQNYGSKAELQQLQKSTVNLVVDKSPLSFTMPPSSVSFVVLSAAG